MAIYIKDLIEIGVSSFKVEGRMRSLYYLATVIGTYREIIDAYYDNRLDDDKIEERNYFEVGNKVCLFTPSGDREEFLVEELFDEDMKRVDVARHPDQIYYIKHDFSFPVVEYSMLMVVL